jgi:hypothetical protein
LVPPLRVEPSVKGLTTYPPSRVQTQSGPPNDGSGDCDSRGKVSCELVVAGRNTSPIFEAAVGALDEIAQLVCFGIEWVEMLSRRIVWDHRKRAPIDEELSQCIAVIGHVSNAQARRR